MQSIQQKLDSKTEICNRLMKLVYVLQYGSDQEATTLLARLRLGESIENLLTERSEEKKVK